MKDKIKTLNQLLKILSPFRKNKSIGFISGCFDILHIGHIDLISFAKEKVDILIVGLEADKSVKRNKGKDRPINCQTNRAKVLSELKSVDFVLLLTNTSKFGSQISIDYYRDLTVKLKPTYLLTTKESDKYIDERKEDAKISGAKLIAFSKKSDTSTTKLLSELNIS